MSNIFMPDLNEASRLMHAGLRIVKLKSYSKAPEGDDWNTRIVREIDTGATGYGLLLEANMLCSIDPDQFEFAKIGMGALGFDLEGLLSAGVRTRSTRPGSGGRSTFAADGDISWIKFLSPATGVVLEFRAHSSNLQDAIPGVVYSTKDGELCTQTYANCKRLDDAPPMPDKLFEWWERCSTDIDFLHEQQRIFFEAIGRGKPSLSISTGRTGRELAFPAPGIRGPFNATTRVESILEGHNYGYDKKTRRWFPPTATGAPGIRAVPGKTGLWASDYASDPLNGVFDAWVAHVILDHAGDVDAAKAAWTASQPNAVASAPLNLLERSAAQVAPNLNSVPTGNARSPSTTTATELLQTEFAPLRWCVSEILPEGTYLLSAKPKVGKSWLALQMGHAIAVGGEVLGKRVDGGSVLVLALEDNMRRLKSRLRKLGASVVIDGDNLGRLHVKTEWPRLDQGGADAIEGWLQANPDARLVVIDTLAKFRPSTGGRTSAYEQDYQALAPVKALSDKYCVTILVVTHNRKMESEDPIDKISGTLGLSGGCDGALVIERMRGSNNATLHLIGRDIENDGAFAIQFIKQNCTWAMVGDAHEIAASSEREALLKLFREEGRPLAPKDVAELTGRKPGTVRRLMTKMASAGNLINEKGVYRLPGADYGEQSEQSEQGEQGEQGEQSERDEHPEQREHGEQGEHPERNEQPEQRDIQR